MMNQLSKWGRRHRWVVVLVCLILAVTPAFISIQIQQAHDRNLLECVTAWGDEVASRSEYLSEQIAARDMALDDVVRSVAANDSAAFETALREYVEASDALRLARDENPQPDRPTLRCNGG